MKRSFRDIASLQANGFPCEVSEQTSRTSGISFSTRLFGPIDTPYREGEFQISFHLPETFPFSSPSVGFLTKIFHPNIDERSGTICLDVIGSSWTPMYSLLNVMEHLLPQLLSHPNPLSPLNGEAAALLLRSSKDYDARVEAHVKLNAPRRLIPASIINDIRLDSTPVPVQSDETASLQTSLHPNYDESDDGSSILSDMSELSLT
jgi:ubiquitin-protein ligase